MFRFIPSSLEETAKDEFEKEVKNKVNMLFTSHLYNKYAPLDSECFKKSTSFRFHNSNKTLNLEIEIAKVGKCENATGNQILNGIVKVFRELKSFADKHNNTSPTVIQLSLSAFLWDASEIKPLCVPANTRGSIGAVSLQFVSALKYNMSWYNRYGFYKNKELLKETILQNKKELDSTLPDNQSWDEFKRIVKQKQHAPSIEIFNDLRNKFETSTYRQIGHFLLTKTNDRDLDIASCNDYLIVLQSFAYFCRSMIHSAPPIFDFDSFESTTTSSFPIRYEDILGENKKRQRAPSPSPPQKTSSSSSSSSPSSPHRKKSARTSTSHQHSKSGGSHRRTYRRLRTYRRHRRT